jgi:hypothetical protein
VNVLLDAIATESLRETGTAAEHMIEHHREHLQRCWDCPFGNDGQTAMRAPDGTVLIVSEAAPGIFFISGHRPEAT